MRETKIKINQIDYDFGEGGSGAKTITLLSVTTAPEPPFSIESRYYNSADNLIYKAVDDNTWEDAETFEPTLGTFYIYQGQSYLYDAKTQSLFQIGEYTPEANLVTKNIILSTNTNTAPLNVDLTNAVIFGVYLNGLYQLTTEHYSISSSAITFTSVYPAGTSITIVYSNSLTLSVHGQSGGGGNVDDVQLDGQSVLNNRIANINVGGGDNIWSYSADGTIYNDFAGYGYQVLNFIVGEDIQIEDNHQLNFDFWVRISTGTLIFRNGQLLELMEDYDIPNNTSLYIHDTLANNDKISIINGLSKLTTITGIIGNTIHCNYYINENTLIFKNGLLLSDEDYHTNNGDIIFEQNLVSSDKITLIKCVTNTFHNTEVSGSTFSYEGPFNNLVFKNGQLLISDIDYEIESMDEESHVTLRFFEPLNNDVISMIYNEPYSLYALFGDKQNSLPLYENGKVLGTDGHQLKWITQDYNNLTNKPTINNVALSGNSSSSDLGLQDILISGTNIKTINNQSILGSGNIDIQGGTDLPDQTGQSGKFLTTDGTNLSWGTPQGGGSSYTAGGGLYIDNNEIGINKNTAFYNHLYINSKDDNIQDSDISFDENTFFTYTGGADNNFYNFIYMNGTWNLRVMDYSTDPWDWDYIGEVDLADYGIIYNDTPFENGWFILAGNYLTGKTSFTVIMLSFSNVFLNGILLTEGLDFIRNDNTITFINYTLKATDRIQIL